jgi:hypothetical protein
MPLIQWQSPSVGSWLAHCLKSTTPATSVNVVVASGT